MNSERFGQIRAVFEAAIEMPEAERERYVDTVCDGDEELRREVRAMLDADKLNRHRLPTVETGSSDSATPPSSPEEGRFPAGTVLVGRYRILGVLGRGGMGEVYRAFDITLNQTVALKFLPPGRLHESTLVRFRNEVRIARQISHPNVCRVYDLGMAEGMHFISMEYIDGEDLASLLRRIGRLPQDKAIEFTRKICAGLMAAHDRGVLHRDLKPTNIMIDGRGQVRITDFGLAALAEEIPLSDLSSGTPAYMAPEQRAGKENTVRSDIYSLGLVLHEMFTGETYRKESDSSPTDLVSGFDPLIEQVILRCLEEDPKRRPPSARRVAMALPGGDPLADALAAGETPSPETVEASDDIDALSPRSAVLCLIVIVAGLVGIVFLRSQNSVLSLIPEPDPPEVLSERARGIAESLGYDTSRRGDSVYGFRYDDATISWANEQLEPGEYRAMLADTRLSPIRFWYREGPQALIPRNARAFPDPDDPPLTSAGMLAFDLDLEGRLLRFRAVPPESEQRSVPSATVEWSSLLGAAGLDSYFCDTATPASRPPVVSDERIAWTCRNADANLERHVEAAAWSGRPVYFEIVEQWRADLDPEPVGSPPFNLLVQGLMAVGAMMAWRNYRAGRGDVKGAFRLGAFFFLTVVAESLLLGHKLFYANPFPAPGQVNGLHWALAFAVYVGVVNGMSYIALEPYVRRRWPRSLISWKRVLSGRWRDPVVAGHVLLGIASAVGMLLFIDSLFSAVAFVHRPSVDALPGLGAAAGVALREGAIGLGVILLLFLMYFLLRVLLGSNWRAAIAAFAAFFSLIFFSGVPLVVAAPLSLVLVGVPVGLLWRYGFLPLSVASVVAFLATSAPMILNFGAWYSVFTVLVIVIVIGLTWWSFTVALGGRSLVRQELLEL